MSLLRTGCFLLLLFLTGCVTVKYSERIEDYDEKIYELKEQLRINPDDGNAARDLGVIYFQTRYYDEAKEYLNIAAGIDQNDPKTMFYSGLSLEFDQREEKAIYIYARYNEVSRLSPYRKLMLGRYQWLTRKIARQEISKLVEFPITINTARIVPGTIAVFPLLYRGGEPRYAPLGRGLSEMLLIDLGQIAELKLVERLRIQVLLDELAFAKSQYVDPKTAPRYGQLLGADKIVGGLFDVTNDHRLMVDIAFWDMAGKQTPAINNREGTLDELFKFEKELVLAVVAELGIYLTPEEEAAIMEAPTQNLQAFVAYCLGLEKEDSGQFEDALDLYMRAIDLDPGFQQAIDRAEAAEGLNLTAGSKENVLKVAWQSEHGPEVSSELTMTENRLQRLDENLGTIFIPGEDNRRPMEDAVETGFGELPPPPPPPSSGSGGN